MKAFKDLREFLQILEAEKQLLRISEEVSLEPGLAAAARAINQVAGETSPPIHFERIKGYRNAYVTRGSHILGAIGPQS
jgi:vanillate/4-hydroxybenzoate decarboxylase subunit C